MQKHIYAITKVVNLHCINIPTSLCILLIAFGRVHLYAAAPIPAIHMLCSCLAYSYFQ